VLHAGMLPLVGCLQSVAGLLCWHASHWAAVWCLRLCCAGMLSTGLHGCLQLCCPGMLITGLHSVSCGCAVLSFSLLGCTMLLGCCWAVSFQQVHLPAGCLQGVCAVHFFAHNKVPQIRACMLPTRQHAAVAALTKPSAMGPPLASRLRSAARAPAPSSCTAGCATADHAVVCSDCNKLHPAAAAHVGAIRLAPLRSMVQVVEMC
jgi:hypothetical protein